MEPQTFIDTPTVIDIFLKVTDRVGFFWNFYLLAVIAIVGWLLSSGRTLTRYTKVLMITAYLLFGAANAFALFDNYSFLRELVGEIQTRTNGQPFESPGLSDKVMGLSSSFLAFRWISVAMHVVIDPLLALAIWRH